MAVKMNLRIITKSHAADPEIEFRTKSISRPNDRATAMPTAWELIHNLKSRGKSDKYFQSSDPRGLGAIGGTLMH